jgi:hypothetical protein
VFLGEVKPQMDLRQTRTTKDVIDQAIDENKATERLYASLTLLLTLTGAVSLLWAVKHDRPMFALGAILIIALSYFPLHVIRKTRRENLAIRLLEVPLNRANSASDAALAVSIFLQPLAEHEVEARTDQTANHCVDETGEAK